MSNTHTTEETEMSQSTLVEGTVVEGVVTAKNQHGATVKVGDHNTFLPTDQFGGKTLSKGDTVTVTVTVLGTIKGKTRVTASATTSEPVVETVESAEDDFVSQLEKLAAEKGWGFKRETRKKGAEQPQRKPSARPVTDTVAAVAPVNSTTDGAVAPVESTSSTKENRVEETIVAPAKSAKVQYLESLKVGDPVDATVKFTKEFGAFMQVGAAFGLLHESQVPGKTPSERRAYIAGLRYKQQLKVHVVSIDLAKERLGLSLIAGEKAAFFATLAVGSLVEGTVTGVKEIGAFVNLGPTTGFLHVSQVEGNTREQRDANLPTLKDQKVTLVVVDVNREKQEVRLSQRHVGLAKFTVGSEVEGTFLNFRQNKVVVDLSDALGYMARADRKPYESDEVIKAVVKSLDFATGSVELVSA